MSRFRKLSIRMIIFFLLLLAGAGGCIFVSVSLYRSGRAEILDSGSAALLKEHSEAIADHIRTSGFVRRADDESVIDELYRTALLFKGRAFVCNSELKVLFDTAGIYQDRYFVSEDAGSVITGKSQRFLTNGSVGTLLVSLREPSDNGKIAGVLCFSVPLTKECEQIASLRSRALSYCIFFLVILTGFAIFACERIRRPMHNLAEAMLDHAENYSADPIDVRISYREIGEIVRNANRMIEKINEAEESRKAFVSNVSHELKTPMSSMKVLADSLLSEENVPVEMYREFLTDINSEIERENRIITDLLTLVGMDGKESVLKVSKTHINRLIEIVLNRILPLAKEQNIEIVYNNYRDVYAEVDENRLIMALTNIVENSVKYNRPDGHVHVSLNSDINYFDITIEDSGIGIPEEAIPHLFERFYRVDKARSRETGGNGLGLSIAYEVVRAHRGSIRVTSKLGEGSRFRIRIPFGAAKETEGGGTV